MTQPTLAQIIERVDNELDLTDEVMITSAEKTAYVNAAINDVEQLIIPLYEDYFLQKESLALVSGQSEYDFPSNIYAHKIRKVFYSNGTEKYEIRRIRRLSDVPEVDDSDDYRYLVLTTSSGGFKIKFYPASRETSSANVEIWFLGNAKVLSADSDTMNIPEAFNLIVEKVKLMCARKEGHPTQITLEAEVDKQERRFIEVIAAMVPDEDNEILMDEEMIYDLGGYSGY
jgi:hypothetical protein